jgi:hypothetical protein
MFPSINRAFCVALTVLAATPVLAHDVPDLTRLPVGDGRLSDGPKRGSVWACPLPAGGGGAHAAGSWLRGDGTFDLTAKPSVRGAVAWPHRMQIKREDDARRVDGNGLPNHTTGIFPIAPTDEAFRYDRNPNAIAARDVVRAIAAQPNQALHSTCLPLGPIGVMLTGAAIFSALDARGQDAVAHEIQDACQGHPERNGTYHYHSLSLCQEGPEASDRHSPLYGYAFDGFGIFGHRGEGGATLTNADLDECHGHTHAIDWDGERRVMFHYHATWEYPYTLGCFRGLVAGIGTDGRGRFGPQGGPGRGLPPPGPGPRR